VERTLDGQTDKVRYRKVHRRTTAANGAEKKKNQTPREASNQVFDTPKGKNLRRGGGQKFNSNGANRGGGEKNKQRAKKESQQLKEEKH